MSKLTMSICPNLTMPRMIEYNTQTIYLRRQSMNKLYIAKQYKGYLCKIGVSTNPPSYIHHLRWKYGIDFRLETYYPIDHKLLSGSYSHADIIIKELLHECKVDITNKDGNVSREIYDLRLFPVQKVFEFLVRESCVTVPIDQLPTCKVCNQSFNFMAYTFNSIDELITQFINSICCRQCALKLFERVGQIEECMICHEKFTVKHNDMLCCSTKCEAILKERRAIKPTQEEKEQRNKRTWQL